MYTERAWGSPGRPCCPASLTLVPLTHACCHLAEGSPGIQWVLWGGGMLMHCPWSAYDSATTNVPRALPQSLCSQSPVSLCTAVCNVHFFSLHFLCSHTLSLHKVLLCCSVCHCPYPCFPVSCFSVIHRILTDCISLTMLSTHGESVALVFPWDCLWEFLER